MPVKKSADAPDDPYPAMNEFDEMPLPLVLRENLRREGFEHPTPIQKTFIPKALAGRDVMGQARTGTGKTAAFLLPIFQRLLEENAGDAGKKPSPGVARSLILSPTRELALQIHGEIKRLGTGLKLSSVVLYGGADYGPQIEALRRGVDLVVGTPGRTMDHLRSRRLSLSETSTAVLDEADRMLDLGFRRDIEYLLRHCPRSRQTLLLSATFPDDIRRLSRRFMREPLEVWTAGDKLTVDAVEQHYCVCTREEKMPLLLKVLETQRPKAAIVFCRTKRMTRLLAERLAALRINAKDIHGDLDQRRREKIMNAFRHGRIRVLVATDVAARGLDISHITHIFNYDIPLDPEDYIHRIGRTGRMESTGFAMTFVEKEEAGFLTAVEVLINREIKPLSFDSLESRWWPKAPKEPAPEDAEFFAAARESGDFGGATGGSMAPARQQRRRRNRRSRPGRTGAGISPKSRR